MSDYKTMADKIRSAKTVDDLLKLDTSLCNLYINGIFSVSEFSRLDSLIVNQHIKIEIN